MKIVLGEAKEEYDTDVQMAVTRQLILRVIYNIFPSSDSNSIAAGSPLCRN